jgi:hypothetical protein
LEPFGQLLERGQLTAGENFDVTVTQVDCVTGETQFSATRRVLSRKNTPWTRPLIVNRRANDIR